MHVNLQMYVHVSIGHTTERCNAMYNTKKYSTDFNSSEPIHTIPHTRRPIEGVGICIPALLGLLDQYGINHIEESLLRTLIRNRKGCKSRTTQYFLRPGEKKKVIERDSSSIAVSCVCIPYKDIPEQFILILSQGTYI